MASVCVNNVGVSQEFSSYGCFNPRASFSRDDGRSSGSAVLEMQKQMPEVPVEEAVGADDFEFMLEDPVGMLPADELFSGGKLVTKQQPTEMVESDEKCRRIEVEMEISNADNCLFSPKAPRCSSRWREFLGLKRFSQTTKAATTAATTTTFPSNPRSSTSSLKQFLHWSSRSSSSSDSSLLSLPLLKDSDCEFSVTSSRISLSSSCSGHDHEDLPRFSLDAERPNHNHNHILNQNLTANPFAPARSLNQNPPRMRLVKRRDSNHSAAGTGGRVGRSPMRRLGGETSQTTMNRGVSVDSPRLNSSGKIIFHSLERSSSSPSSFNGGTSGYRHRGMERSYSSNVRVTPVLNVPVCSIRGGSVIFGQFFSSSNSASSQHNRTGNGSNNHRTSSSHHQHHGGISRGRNSTDRN